MQYRLDAKVTATKSKPGSGGYGVSLVGTEHQDREFAIQKIVPLQTLLRLRRLYHGSALIQQLRSLLQKSVWSAGMSFFRKDARKSQGNGNEFRKIPHRVPWEPPLWVQETLDRTWITFQHAVLDSLLMYGFVVVHYQYPSSDTIADERETRYPYPTVVPAELYRLCISTSLTGGTRLIALHTRTQNELEDTVVYSNFGFNPTVDGKLTSLVRYMYVCMGYST